MSIITELKRRNVFRVGLAYILMGWVLLQGTDFVLDLIGAPDWVIRVFALAVAVGLPIALFFAWAFEVTPEGIKREADIDRSASIAPNTGRKLDRVIIIFLAVALALVLGERFFYTPGESVTADAQPAPASTVSSDAAEPAPEAGNDRRSVAVLPFDFRSNNPDDEFFAEGIHDDLLTQLAKIGSLKVISRTSVMEYRDTTKKLPQIAKELGVATIVEGGVQRSGSRIRLNAQLIDASTDEHLWAETFDRELTAENLFDIQAEVSRAIASALEATLSPREEAQLDRVLTRNLQAWESYQRALRFRQAVETASIETGLGEIEHTLSLDPDFAAAWSLKAILLLQKFWFYERDPDLREQAMAAITRGRELQPGLPELDLAEGYYHYWGFLDYPAAMKSLNLAAAALPGNHRIAQARAYVLRRMGNWEECLAAFSLAAELNPRDGPYHAEWGALLSSLKRFDEADRVFEHALDLSPDGQSILVQYGVHQMSAHADLDLGMRYARLGANAFPEGYLAYWQMSLMNRDLDTSLRIVELWPVEMLDVRVFNVTRDFLRGMTHLLYGNVEKGRALLETEELHFENLVDSGQDGFTTLKTLCQIKGGLGKTDEAIELCGRAAENLIPEAYARGNYFLDLAEPLAITGAYPEALEMLQRALSEPSGPSAYSVTLNPAFDELRNQPGYQELIDQHKHWVDP